MKSDPKQVEQVAYSQGMVQHWLESDGKTPKPVLDAFKEVSEGYDRLRKELDNQAEKHQQELKHVELLAEGQRVLNQSAQSLSEQQSHHSVQLQTTLETCRCVVNPGAENEIWAGNAYTDGRDKFLALPPFRIYLRLDELFALAKAIQKEKNLPIFIDGWTLPIDDK